MTAETTDEPAYEPVRVTIDLPGRIVHWYDVLTEKGIFLSREDALRQAVINSWRFEQGSFHNLRLDVRENDAEAEPGAAAPAAEADGAS